MAIVLKDGKPDRKTLLRVLQVISFVLIFAHCFISPHTKVEETPGLHAVWDILRRGISPQALQSYEHVVYPGPVPRSMIASLAIAFISAPLISLGRSLGLVTSGLGAQIIVRLVLASAFSLSLGHLIETVYRDSPVTAVAFALLSWTQFHVPYYSSRTLPNFLALPLVIYALSSLLREVQLPGNECVDLKTDRLPLLGRSRRSISTGLAILSFTATVIRLELAAMVLATALVLLYQRKYSFSQLVLSGAMGGLTGLASTSIIDGYFYRPTSHHLKWFPELSAFIFNIPQGRASEWGESPWWFYLSSLPRLLLASLPLAIYALSWMWKEVNAFGVIVWPCVASLAAMSFVPHKEWRFVVYAVPLFNILAAGAFAKMWMYPTKTVRRLLRISLVCMLVCNALITVAMTSISSQNYPGGQVGPILSSLVHTPDAKVWLPAGALHTGTTLFTLPEQVLHNMTIIRPESAYEACSAPVGNSPGELWLAGFDYAVTDDWDSFERFDVSQDQYERGREPYWVVLRGIDGYTGVQTSRSWPYVSVKTGTRLAVMGRGER